MTSRRRQASVQWLRRVHGWTGLWGAVLGLLFGTTGVLLDHRAVLELPAARTQERNVQLAAPVPAPASAVAMADWVRNELQIAQRATRVREEPARAVPWDSTLTQPAHWTAVIATPRASHQVDYWVGNDVVNVRAVQGNAFATLNNLHKGAGLGVAWVLLADTVRGAMVLLSLTGVLVWTLLHRRRLIGVAVAATSVAVTIGSGRCVVNRGSDCRTRQTPESRRGTTSWRGATTTFPTRVHPNPPGIRNGSR